MQFASLKMSDSIAVPTSSSSAGARSQYHVLSVSSSSYSHTIQTCGVLYRLLQSGNEFFVTLVTYSKCVALTERFRRRLESDSNISSASRLRIIPVAISTQSQESMQRTYTRLDKMDVFLNDKFDNDFELFRAYIDAHDEPFRAANSNLIQQLTALNAQQPFNVAICDQLSLGAIEFADQLGIATLLTAWQSYPIPRDVFSNGVWMPYCTSEALRHRSPANDSFMLRIHAYFDYYIRYPSNVRMLAKIQRYSKQLRDKKPHAFFSGGSPSNVRHSYPRIDQRISGTILPAAYRRPDHCVCGPMWFELSETFEDMRKQLRESSPLTDSDQNGSENSSQMVDQDLHQIETALSIKSWLDATIEPVVYVSFGTTTRFTIDRMRLLIEALCSEQWLTLWSACDTAIYNQILSEKHSEWRERARHRIRAVAWLPQYEILQHPSVKLFITHAGSTSVLEAMACSMPMVCIPIAADQYYHAQRVAALGLGVRLDKRLATPEFLPIAILRVLNTRNYAVYKQNCMRIEAYHKSVSEISRLVDFVRHFAQFGYRYTELPDETYNWIKYWSYDVAATVTVACLAIVGGSVVATFVVLKRTGLLGRFVRYILWNTITDFVARKIGLRAAEKALENADAGEPVKEEVAESLTKFFSHTMS